MREFESLNIRKLLPQQPPFVMVDKLLWFDKVKTVTSLTVRSDNIFFDNGSLSASGLIENIAQTCAARMGYINLFIAQDNVKLGFIGSIRNLQIIRKPKADEVLVTTIEVMEEVLQMTLVNAKIMSGDNLLVSAEMKIALSNIDSEA